MSSKPIPAALTACRLAHGWLAGHPGSAQDSAAEFWELIFTTARLASEIHRLAEPCRKLEPQDTERAAYLDKRIGALNGQLAPFHYKLNRGKILLIIQTGKPFAPFEIT